MKDIDENGVDRMERFRGYSQRFTQFSVADEVYRETLEYMKHLRQQRDEARRVACYSMVAHAHATMNIEYKAEHFAMLRGWDCFPQKEGGGA